MNKPISSPSNDLGAYLEQCLQTLITKSVETAMEKFVDHRPPKFYNPEQIADRIGVHPETVRQWCRDGNMPYSKFGKYVRIDNADFQAYCKRNKINARK